MGLVTLEYYNSIYLGEPVPLDDFPRLELRAEEQILGLIGMSATNVALLDDETKTLVEKAVCCEIEYLYEYGVGVAVYGKEAGGGFTVGKVSVNNGSATKAAAGAKSMIAPGVYVYLERTGLLNPAVATAPEPWPATRGWMA